MNAETPTLTALAVQNIDVLRAIAKDAPATSAALARQLGRDKSNFAKTLKVLETEGLIGLHPEGHFAGFASLTHEGARALEAWGRAEGANAVRTEPAVGGMAEIPLDLIDTDPVLNPRTTFAEEPLQALAESIRDKGIGQPILVRPSLEPGRWRVVAGERRTRAARMAGLTVIPAMIRELDDDQALEIATIENIQREDLSPMEEARAFSRILEAKLRLHPELSQRDVKEVIAAAVKKTVRYVEQRVDLLQLPPAKQKDVEAGSLSLENARWAVQAIRREEKQREERIMARADLLIVAELVDRCDKHPAKLTNWYYQGKPTEVRYDAGGAALEALTEAHRVSLYPNHDDSGRTYALLGYNLDKKDIVHQAAGVYATEWLNGPFEVDPAQAERVKQKEAAAKAQATKAANAKAKSTAALTATADLVAAIGGDRITPLHADFAAQLTVTTNPAPWTIELPYGSVIAANGDRVLTGQTWGQPDPLEIAAHLLIATAVNAAAGFPPPAFTRPEATAAELEAAE